MKPKTFLLERWIEGHRDPSIQFNLAGSTGPAWQLRDLLALGDAHSLDALLDSNVLYAPSVGSSGLREAIAEMQGVAAEHVVVMVGAAEALAHIFLTSVEAGANVVVPSPCFPPHQALPEALGFEVRSYHLRRENAFHIEPSEIIRLADARTKLILVNSPHNPTGTTISEADLRLLHDFAAERKIQFVCDEVYHPIYHGRETPSAALLPRATVVGDLSKAFSLSGLRIGWIVEPDARRREAYLSAREYITISNSPIVEFLAEIAVRHRDVIFTRTREVARTNLRLLGQVLEGHAALLNWVKPQGGMTAFPWLVSGSETRSLCEAAVADGLLLAPGDCFGMPDHMRIGFGVGPEWYPQAMQRLSAFLARWARTTRAGLAV